MSQNLGEIFLDSHCICIVGVYAWSGSADDAVCVGDSKRDRSARLSVRTEASHHRVPDTQERPQADHDNRRQRPTGSHHRHRTAQQVSVEQRLQRDGARSRRRGGQRRLCW